jgi:hypothetical protein
MNRTLREKRSIIWRFNMGTSKPMATPKSPKAVKNGEMYRSLEK